MYFNIKENKKNLEMFKIYASMHLELQVKK